MPRAHRLLFPFDRHVSPIASDLASIEAGLPLRSLPLVMVASASGATKKGGLRIVM